MRAPGIWAVALTSLGGSLACSAGSDVPSAAAGGTTGDGGSGGAGNTGGSAAGGQGTGGVPEEPPLWEIEGVTTWQGGAVAAYTMFYDDTCNSSVDNQFEIADPELTDRGLRASFGAIVGDCVNRNLWSRLLTLQSHGHEIVNHSWSHPNLTMSPVDIAQQMDAARSTLQSNLQEREITFFIFPFDAFNDELVAHLRAQGYLGARAGSRGLNESAFTDDFRVQFDVFGPGYSIYAEAPDTPCADVPELTGWDSVPSSCRQYILDQYVLDTIALGGWGIRELHSIDGEAWEPVPLSEYEAHLDFVKEHVDDGTLWVAPASDVIRYRRARTSCPLPPVSGDWLVFPSPAAPCDRYATELTYVVRPLETAPQELSAQQGSAVLEVQDRGDGTFLVTAHPAGGPVQLTVH